MSNIFELNSHASSDHPVQVDIDELYNKRQQKDLATLELFTKILKRVHVRIKTISRKKNNDGVCWYVVPEVILGVPKYDHGECIAFLMDRLKSNGFTVKYISPNMLFISWANYIPAYIRSEYAKKTGVIVDEHGNETSKRGEKPADPFNPFSSGPPTIDPPRSAHRLSLDAMDYESADVNDSLTHRVEYDKPKREYASVSNYKPSGKILYTDDVLHTLENTMSNR